MKPTTSVTVVSTTPPATAGSMYRRFSNSGKVRAGQSRGHQVDDHRGAHDQAQRRVVEPPRGHQSHGDGPDHAVDAADDEFTPEQASGRCRN